LNEKKSNTREAKELFYSKVPFCRTPNVPENKRIKREMNSRILFLPLSPLTVSSLKPLLHC